jgi:hypothetical protein
MGDAGGNDRALIDLFFLIMDRFDVYEARKEDFESDQIILRLLGLASNSVNCGSNPVHQQACIGCSDAQSVVMGVARYGRQSGEKVEKEEDPLGRSEFGRVRGFTLGFRPREYLKVLLRRAATP